jgi:hypothetical protein
VNRDRQRTSKRQQASNIFPDHGHVGRNFRWKLIST